MAIPPDIISNFKLTDEDLLALRQCGICGSVCKHVWMVGDGWQTGSETAWIVSRCDMHRYQVADHWDKVTKYRLTESEIALLEIMGM